MDFLDDLDENEPDYIPRKRSSIDIPDFLSKNTSELPTEEQLIQQAILNNVPNNTDIEKQNHLAELERACQNWDEEEWSSVIIHASSNLMTKELNRRLEYLEMYIANTRSNMELLASQKL